MPILQTIGNSSAIAWGRLKRVLGLHWLIQNTGSGYGVKTHGRNGNVYYQTYSVTRKLTKNGEFVWGRAFGAGNVNALSTDSSENVYIAGPSGFFVAKFNTNGTVQWQRNLANGTSDNAQDLVASSGGTSYVAGQRSIGGAAYAVIAAVDTNGTTLWSQYNTSSTTYFNAIGLSEATNLVAAVGGYSSGSGVQIVVFNTSGVLQWQRSITTTNATSIYGMGCTMDSSGNVYVTGMAGDPRKNFIIKYNSSGSVQWYKQLEVVGTYSTNDYGTPGVDSAGNIYLSLYYDYNNVDNPNYGGGFAKFNSSGALQFVRKTNVVTGYLRLSVAPDGTVVVMGTAGLLKANGDGSGLGTYGTFTYASSSLVATVPSFLSFNTSGFGYSSASYSSVASSYSSSNPTISPTIEYIGTEVG